MTSKSLLPLFLAAFLVAGCGIKSSTTIAPADKEAKENSGRPKGKDKPADPPDRLDAPEVEKSGR